MNGGKLAWRGRVIGVQPRIRLHRSFDQRNHSYLGYHLRIVSELDGEPGEFLVGVGKAAHPKHGFRVGDELTGAGVSCAELPSEAADIYKASGLKLTARGDDHDPGAAPPFHGLAPELAVYRARGHRRLSAKTYASKCRSCVWGCLMPVEMTIDQWNPGKVKFREETFCYGPKSCAFYASGPPRKVPGRKGMSYTEEDWIDEEETAHRGPDD